MRNVSDLIISLDSILAADFIGSPDGTTARLKEFREKLLRFRDDEAAASRAKSADRDPRSIAADPGKARDAGALFVPYQDIARANLVVAERAEPLVDRYRQVVAEFGPGSHRAADFVAAHADDPTFVGRVDAIRMAHEGHLKYQAALAADARSDARSAFVGKVGRLAWGLVKFASIASAAGYVGRLAWADLAVRYFG
ncbi:MAG: hypothetical protein BGO49_00595 [Planctomycetales bacterium 71-10]|nr:MAG: hypothetical protein BGO49_00595 [Planctomycetales bacterium 71-10]